MKRTLLIGEAPARTTVGARPFTGPTGRRLAELAALAELRDGFDAVNLLDRWPGRAGRKGSAFPLALARPAAEALLPRLRRRRVILVGRRVAAAFWLARLPYLTWAHEHGVALAVLPHPSGVCRWWNEPENVAAASAFLREAAA